MAEEEAADKYLLEILEESDRIAKSCPVRRFEFRRTVNYLREKEKLFEQEC